MRYAARKGGLLSIALLLASSYQLTTEALAGIENKPIIGINLDMEKGEPRQSAISVLYFEAIKKRAEYQF